MPLSQAKRASMLDAAIDATYYVGLSSTAPTTVGGNVTEPTELGYIRKAITEAQWTAATTADPSAKSNNIIIEFDEAGADWVAGANLTHAVLYTAEAAGTFIGSGVLAQAKAFLAGDTPRFGVGAIVIELA
jgi:hypothetical protein